MPLEIRMPQLDPQARPVTLVRWLAAVGQRVQEGEGLLELETEKARMELPAFGSGVLLAVFAEDGDIVAPHTLVGVLGEPGDDIEAFLREAEQGDALDGDQP